MKKFNYSSCILLIAILGLSSCMTTLNLGSVQWEIMKPGPLTFPEQIDTIALFTRDFFQSDTATYKYTSGNSNKLLTDKSIRYQDLSNKCIDSLAHYLESKGYFHKVINYRDSMNYSFSKADSLTNNELHKKISLAQYLESEDHFFKVIKYSEPLNDLFSKADNLTNSRELHKKIGADAYIFLDYFQLDDHLAKYTSTDNIFNIQDAYPELSKSKMFEFVSPLLIWTIFIKNDSTRYIYQQTDDLYFGNSVNPKYFGNNDNHKSLLESASIFMGNSFGSKILPSWKSVERDYYKSNNFHMLKAEKFLLNGDWQKAAEIYKKQTRNKNHFIAAQARYNMAVTCEMEGNLDAATDWLDHSKSAYIHGDPIYNCNEYNILLEKRKKEIELLGKQVR